MKKMINGEVIEMTLEEQEEFITAAGNKTDTTAKNIITYRNRLLDESDWIVTKAIETHAVNGLGVQVPAAWVEYRQALRDIPQQKDFPDNIVWPTIPE